MMLTEEEARTKWCPHGRGVDNDFAAGIVVTNLGCLCLGSDCMQWRWLGRRITFYDGDNGSGTTQTPENDIGKRGYCGLAGRPEAV